MYELRSPGRGVDLVNRHADTWLANHSRFQDDVAVVRSATKTITKLLTTPLLQIDPVEVLDLLKEPLLRFTEKIYVRSHFGHAGAKTFAAKARDVDELPDGLEGALSSAASAGARARSFAVKETAHRSEEAGANSADDKKKTGGKRGRWLEARRGAGRGGGRGTHAAGSGSSGPGNAATAAAATAAAAGPTLTAK
jgi:hypothetical protein